MSKQEYLSKQLDEQIKRFDYESKKHKTLHRMLRYTVFGLTAVSTVLASVSLTFPQWQTGLSLGIVAVTAVIALVAAIDGIRKPGELWIHERTTLYQLKDIKRAFDYSVSHSDQSACPDRYFDQMQAVLGAAGEKWQHQIVSKKPEPTPDT